jgi:hypothetical protein
MAQFSYTNEPVDENEEVLGVFYGNRGDMGSQFVVTNRRLLIGPLNTSIAQEILGWLGGKAGVPGIDVAKSVLGKYGPMSPKQIWLRHVTAVAPGGNGGWFKPPTLQITTDDKQSIELRVVWKPTAMSKDSKNRAARDGFVAILETAVEAAKAHGTGP